MPLHMKTPVLRALRLFVTNVALVAATMLRTRHAQALAHCSGIASASVKFDVAVGAASRFQAVNCQV